MSLFSLIVFAAIATPILLIVLMQYAERQNKEAKEVFQERISKLEDFTASHVHWTTGWSIAVDEQKRKLFLYPAKHSLTEKIYGSEQIIDCSVLANETIITQTKSKNTLGRAVVGGALFGPAGAIVGGLSGKKESISTTRKAIYLCLNVDDAQYPKYVFDLDLNTATKWHNIITNLIQQPDINHGGSKLFSGFSIADELSKLSELRQNGVISESEFQQRKTKLLSQ